MRSALAHVWANPYVRVATVLVGVRDRVRPRPTIGYGSEPVRELKPIDLFAALPPPEARPQEAEEPFRPVPPHLSLVKRKD